MELARQATWSQTRVELFHYRTKDDIEIDAVLESRQGEVVGIEVKAASTLGPEDFRGLHHLAQRLGDDFVAGLVLYTGQDTLSFGHACARCQSARSGKCRRLHRTARATARPASGSAQGARCVIIVCTAEPSRIRR
jgi:hypothetical protein